MTHLHACCRARKIQFTRGRPYKKDDNAHVEQKNWTHVRKHMGYLRYDTEAARTAMNDVYADLRLLQNLFLPSVTLQSKERVGARLRRRYGPPRTPLDRVRACPQADVAKVAALVALQKRLDPFALAARIERKLERVYARGTYLKFARFLESGGWDAAQGFTAYRMLGYPALILLTGVFRHETFAGLIAVQAAMALTMPILVFKIVEVYGRRPAYYTACWRSRPLFPTDT